MILCGDAEVCGRLAWLLVAVGLYLGIPLIQLLPWPDVLLGSIAPGIWDAHQETRTLLDSVVPVATLDIQATLDEFVKRFSYVIFMCVAALVASRRGGIELLSRAVVYSALLNAVYGLANYLTKGDLLFFKPAMHDYLNAVSGTYVNKNHFAGLIEMALPIAAYMAMGRVRRIAGSHKLRLHEVTMQRWVLIDIVVVAVLAIALVLTVSRGALLSMMVAALTGWLLLSDKRQISGNAIRYLALLLAVVFGLFLYLGLGEIAGMYSARGLALGARIDLWMSSLQAYPQYWLLGGGAGAFEALFEPFKVPELGVAIYDHAHNDYIEYLLTTGPFGLAAILLLAFIGLRGLLRREAVHRGEHRSKYVSRGLLIGGLSFCVHGLVDFNFQIPANAAIFFILLGAGLSGYLVQQRQVDTKDSVTAG